MGAPTVVEVIFLKYDGRPHRSYPAQYLGEDDSGTWLGVAAGTPALVDGTRETLREEPYVLLVPHRAWYTAMFNAPPRRTEIYCDITTPARWDGDTVHIVDLDLDVSRRRDSGLVELRDEDEFEEHRVAFGYPDDVVGEARAAARHLVGALGDGTEPFASAYKEWLSAVTD